jgi:hypothetical protein
MESVVKARLDHLNIVANDFGEWRKSVGKVGKHRSAPIEAHVIILHKGRPVSGQGSFKSGADCRMILTHLMSVQRQEEVTHPTVTPLEESPPKKESRSRRFPLTDGKKSRGCGINDGDRFQEP